MEKFNKDTYIVLDLPMNISEKVMKIRSDYDYNMSFPVEITVSGSSGLGVLQHEQHPRNVYATIKKIALMTKPIKAKFLEVSRFPNTNIFFFTLDNESSFVKLHQHFAKSSIKFIENPFPYKAHCTLSNNATLSELEKKNLLSKEITDEFVLDIVSLYTLDRVSSSE